MRSLATIFRTRAVVSQGGIQCLTTHYWDSTGAAPATMATEVVARVRAAFNALAAQITQSASYIPNLLVDEIDENTGNIVGQVTAAAPAAVTFGNVAAWLPVQTQGLVQYQSNLFIAGRRVRGRTYIPALCTNVNTATGAPTAAFTTALGAFNTALGTTIVTAASQRVWHRPDRLTHTGGLSAVVATRTVSPTFAVMRSRRR